MDLLAPPLDAALIAAVREGRTESYAELYRRHWGMAYAYARRLTRTAEDAADVASEAFVRLLARLCRGSGPTDEFRPYLTRTIRNIAYDRAAGDRRLMFTDELSILERAVPFHDPVVEKLERSQARAAFKALPSRWQHVLWLTCVEGRTIDSASQLLGTTPNALTSLSYRAREGLRQAYLQANISRTPAPQCAPHTTRYAALVRGSLSSSARVTTEAHTAACVGCTHLVTELHELNGEVREQTVTRRPAQQSRTTRRRSDRLVAVLAGDGGENDVWTGEQVA